MLNVNHSLERLNIRTNTRLGAAQDVRALIESGTPVTQLLANVFGLNTLDVSFDNANQAIMTAQYIVDGALQHDGDVEDVDIALAAAIRKVHVLENRADMSWMHARPEAKADEGQQEQVSEMVEVTVAVKEDGTIKKGGRQVLAQALYDKYVVQATEKPTNAWFKELLVKELGMTTAGASTYAYNMDQKLKLLVKAQKGKKAA